MKKGKVIVPLALCVCVVLIVIGIALGNNPIRSSVGQSQSAEMNSSEESKASESSDAAESTESASSSSEDPNAGLTSEQIMMGEYWYNDDPFYLQRPLGRNVGARKIDDTKRAI